jgi:TRAP-type mannitol/chloroaromatic compound transport system permease small subunit
MKQFERLDRAFGALVIAANALASFWVFVMMAAVVADVSGRFFFAAPIDGTTELVGMSVIAILYMQVAYTLRSGRMTRSDAFLTRLIERHPATGHALEIAFHVAGAALMGVIMSAAWPKWIDSYDSGFYVGAIGVFTFPEWPMFLIVFVGCGLTALQFLAVAAVHAGALARPRARS